MAQPPEVAKPAEPSPVKTRDPAEVALTAIAEALALPNVSASDALAKTGKILEETASKTSRPVGQVLLTGSGMIMHLDPVSVDPVSETGKVSATEASEDEALTELVKTLKESIDARLGSPDDHLASIRNELKSVNYVRS